MPVALTKSVCVFCGSRPGNDPAYTEAATAHYIQFGFAEGRNDFIV